MFNFCGPQKNDTEKYKLVRLWQDEALFIETFIWCLSTPRVGTQLAAVAVRHTKQTQSLPVSSLIFINSFFAIMNLGKAYLLVVQHNIWPPNVIGRNVELFDTAVLFGVPNQFVVKPKLFNPKICRHDLVFQVLQKNERAYFGDLFYHRFKVWINQSEIYLRSIRKSSSNHWRKSSKNNFTSMYDQVAFSNTIFFQNCLTFYILCMWPAKKRP